MADIRSLTSPEGLDELLDRMPLTPFTQSWVWGEFQQQIGRKIWRLGAFDDQQLVGSALVVAHQLLLGKTYLYCPRGPVATSQEILLQLMQAIAKLGRTTGAMYVKIDLGSYPFPFGGSDFPSGFTIGTTLQPRQTLVVNLKQSTDELLAQMHPKTRYNIRLAEKKEVHVRWSTSEADIQSFLNLMHSTAARQGIRLHADSYYRTMFKLLAPENLATLVIGEYHHQVVVANVVLRHGHSVTYLHGGSSDEHKEVMAPHLVQWRTMTWAKEQGCANYDFWGIAPSDQPTHKLAGVGRFKKGFGGQELEFPPAANCILQPSWYWSYRLAKRMRGGVDE